MGRAAREKNRAYIGCADGEDLQINHKPPWCGCGSVLAPVRAACTLPARRSRAPDLGVLVGSGPLSEKVRDTLAAKRAASSETKVDFLGFANFMSHLLEWGMKLILSGQLTPVQLLGYQFQLLRVSEEHGGARTAYEYDLRLRRKIATRPDCSA